MYKKTTQTRSAHTSVLHCVLKMPPKSFHCFFISLRLSYADVSVFSRRETSGLSDEMITDDEFMPPVEQLNMITKAIT